MAVKIEKPHSSGMYLPYRMWLDWFGLYEGQKKKGEQMLMTVNIMATRRSKGIKKSRTECVNALSPTSLCSWSENLIKTNIMSEKWAVAEDKYVDQQRYSRQ
jgi:hypothetical protein